MRLKAGETNGAQTMVRATAAPPVKYTVYYIKVKLKSLDHTSVDYLCHKTNVRLRI